MGNPLDGNGGSLLISAAALGLPPNATWRAEARAITSQQPLSKREIIRGASFLEPARATHLGPIGVIAQRAIAAPSGQYKVVVAIWPDGVAAVLWFDPRQTRPRGKQLVRAYHGARAAARLSMAANSAEEGRLPC